MKKSLLLVGAFLTVAAMAQAKEVVPAPVVVTEAPVQVVEKEVIVYRDRAPVGFRPNGYVDLQYRWYGETENKENGENPWAGKTNYSRIQLQGKINMTENQTLEYRVRDYNSVTSKEGTGKNGADTRLRYFYNHGNLGDSNVNLTSRIHYRDRNDTTPNRQELEYQARFNFADYMFNNDYVKTTDFVLAPKYGYQWNSNDDDYDNQLGVDLYTMHEFPLGFSFEFNMYNTQHFYGRDHVYDRGNKIKDKNFTIDVEAYIYNTTNLYTNGDVTVDFNFEGGYDPYTWSQYKQFGKYENQKQDYSLYAQPTVQFNYQATPFVKLYVAAGAEYRNWKITAKSDAKDWRWQPLVFAGFRASF